MDTETELEMEDAKDAFRRRVEDRLFRSEILMRARLKYVIARFCMVSCSLHISLHNEGRRIGS